MKTYTINDIIEKDNKTTIADNIDISNSLYFHKPITIPLLTTYLDVLKKVRDWFEIVDYAHICTTINKVLSDTFLINDVKKFLYLNKPTEFRFYNHYNTVSFNKEMQFLAGSWWINNSVIAMYHRRLYIQQIIDLLHSLRISYFNKAIPITKYNLPSGVFVHKATKKVIVSEDAYTEIGKFNFINSLLKITNRLILTNKLEYLCTNVSLKSFPLLHLYIPTATNEFSYHYNSILFNKADIPYYWWVVVKDKDTSMPTITEFPFSNVDMVVEAKIDYLIDLTTHLISKYKFTEDAFTLTDEYYERRKRLSDKKQLQRSN